MIVATTRFTNKTKQENTDYKIKKNICERNVIYGTPLKINPKLETNVEIIIIEMNNDENKICGISKILNFIHYRKRYKIYSDNNYNRHIYKGGSFIYREELYEINSQLVEIIEKICFKGKSHLKRIQGICCIGDKLLKDERCENINIQNELLTIMSRFHNNIQHRCSNSNAKPEPVKELLYEFIHYTR